MSVLGPVVYDVSLADCDAVLLALGAPGEQEQVLGLGEAYVGVVGQCGYCVAGGVEVFGGGLELFGVRGHALQSSTRNLDVKPACLVGAADLLADPEREAA